MVITGPDKLSPKMALIYKIVINNFRTVSEARLGTGARGAKWGVEMTLKREKLLRSLVVERER